MKKLTLSAAAQALVARQKFPRTTTSHPGNKGNNGTGKDGYQKGYGEVKKGSLTTKGGVQKKGSMPNSSHTSGMSSAAPKKVYRVPQNPSTPGKIEKHVSGSMTEAARILLARKAA